MTATYMSLIPIKILKSVFSDVHGTGDVAAPTIPK